MARPKFMLQSALFAITLFLNVCVVYAASKPESTTISPSSIAGVELIYVTPYGWREIIPWENLKDGWGADCKVTLGNYFGQLTPSVKTVLELQLTPASDFHYGYPDAFVYVEFHSKKDDSITYWFALDRGSTDKLLVNGKVVKMEPAFLELITCLLPKYRVEEFQGWVTKNRK